METYTFNVLYYLSRIIVIGIEIQLPDTVLFFKLFQYRNATTSKSSKNPSKSMQLCNTIRVIFAIYMKLTAKYFRIFSTNFFYFKWVLMHFESLNIQVLLTAICATGFINENRK